MSLRESKVSNRRLGHRPDAAIPTGRPNKMRKAEKSGG